MLKSILVIVLTVSGLVARGAHALGGSGGDCKAVAKQALHAVGMDNANYVMMDAVGSGASSDKWYWFTLPNCANTGYVNVVTDANCYVRSVSTRYGCNIPGVPHWNI